MQIRVGPLTQEQTNAVAIIVNNCADKRRETFVVLRVHISPMVENDLNYRRPMKSRVMQSVTTLAIALLYVGVALKQLLHLMNGHRGHYA
jgi:hypothetical protein